MSVRWNAPNVVELKLPEIGNSRQKMALGHPESTSSQLTDKKNVDIIAKLNTVKSQQRLKKIPVVVSSFCRKLVPSEKSQAQLR